MIHVVKPKALVFDMDDTLIAEEASAEAAFLGTCELAQARYGIEPRELHATVRQICRRFWHAAPVRAYCIEIGISSWEALWARFEGPGEPLKVLREWAPRYRRNSWHEALQHHGVNDLKFAAELAEVFPRNRRKLHDVYADVRPTLEHFRQLLRLGLLTNGASDLQREKLASAGIADYFDQVVISGDLGVGKPDPRIYEAILSRLGVTAPEAVMIGNSLESDIRGAQAVGMKAIWLNRAGTPRDDAVVPDAEVRSLTELRQLSSPGPFFSPRTPHA
jgi:putative hydrolase of the HAD superfamily